MQWQKPSDDLVAVFHASLPEDEAIQRRKMFGYPCAFVNGNMFAGLHGTQLFVRLPESLYQQLVDERGATPFEPMPGRAMKGYATLPEALLGEPDVLRNWVARSFEAIAVLPPKERKARARRAK